MLPELRKNIKPIVTLKNDDKKKKKKKHADPKFMNIQCLLYELKKKVYSATKKKVFVP